MTPAKIMTLLSSTLLLSGCAISVTSGPGGPMKHAIFERTLPSMGTSIKYGYRKPASSWGCRQVLRKQYNWAMQKFKGMADFAGGYEHLSNVAVQYADKNKLKANYIYLYIPTETDIMGINVTAMRKASVIYYQCRSLPPATTKLKK